MDDRIIKKMLTGTMVVMVVTVLSTMLGMLVDGIVISRYLGEAYTAAYGIANPIFNLLVAVNGVLAAGIQVLCSKHIGSGNFERAKQVHTVSMIMALIISVVLMLVMWFGAEPIGSLLGAHGKNVSLLPEVADYLRGLSLGVPGLMLAFVISSFMQIDSDRTRMIIAVVVMTVINISGDFIVAKVLHGGLFQMALATTISYYVALVIGFTHYLKKNLVLTFYFKGLKLRDAFKVIKFGAPSGVVNICITLRNIVINRLLLLVATHVAVAAFTIQNTLSAAAGAVSTGLGMAVLLVSGIVAGEEDKNSAVNLVRIMMKLGLIIALIEMAVVFIFAEPLSGIFCGKDVSLLKETTYCVRIYAFGFIGNVLNSMLENYVQGLGRVAFANFIVVLDTFFYYVLVAWILGWGFSLPLGYIWASWAIGEAMVLLTVIIIAWKRNGHIPIHFSNYTFFPKGFGVDEQDTFNCTVYTMEEMIEKAMEIEKFCTAHGAEYKLAMKLHLCIEEFGANVIRHGFSSDDKKHSIDIRVIKKDDRFTIRMRDDCRPFDPKAWHEMHCPEDITKNIGIRMVFGLARDIKYVNTMELNNLVIEV
ncbi:MAG: ATP-binding protein [Eubacterium sp.]|nr:ATP-binding protein [Eubacterium sp.]